MSEERKTEKKKADADPRSACMTELYAVLDKHGFALSPMPRRPIVRRMEDGSFQIEVPPPAFELVGRPKED